jgi:hypothetical protein
VAKIGAILGAILVIQIIYSLGAAFYVYLQVRDKQHKRYDDRHIYATLGLSEYHVPREVLELHMHIKDSRIQNAPKGATPTDPKVFLSWGLALLLPRIVGRAFRPFDDAI